MIFLWAFLLLAVATGSVQSQACSCPCSQEQAVKETIQKESHRFTELKFDSVLNLGLVFSLLDSLLNTINNLAIVDVDINTVKIDGTGLYVELNLNSNCKEIKEFFFSLKVTVELSVETLDGCANYDYLEDTLLIEISINGESLTINKVVLEALVKAVKLLLEGAVKLLLNLVCNTLNNLSGRLTESYYIGETECHNQATNVVSDGGLITGDICTYIRGVSSCWDKVGETSLAENEYQLVHIPSNIVSIIITQFIELILVKIKLEKEILKSIISVDSYDSEFYLDIHLKGLNKCAFQDDGVHLDLEVEAHIYSGETIVATGTVVVTVIAQTNHYYGYFGLFIDANIDLDIDITLTYTHESCGCGDTITDTLNRLLKLHLHLLFGETNCYFKRLLPLPILGGLPGTTGQCVSKTDYCRCALLK